MAADALIAVLFLTQTSGGSNIMFRYPPHPRQPLRVSRPVYQRATADGGAITARRQKKGGYKDRARPYLGAETSISQAVHWRDNPDRRRSGTSPESDGTDLDDVEEARWAPLHAAPGDSHEGRSKRERKPKPEIGGQERVRDRRGNERVKGWDADRQLHTHTASPATGTGGLNQGPGSGSTGNGSGDIREYDNCLGYELAVLNALLSPQRALCHKRFQLVVDDLVFLGHPVCADVDGKWKVPDEGIDENESGQPERGRRNRTDGPVQPASKPPPRNMDVITEGVVADPSTTIRPDVPDSSDSNPATSFGTQTPQPADHAKPLVPPSAPDPEPLIPLTAFHMVLVFDKPDRSAVESNEMDVASLYDTMYREVVFQWTAAAWAEQVRDSWVSKEAKKISLVREEAITKFASLKQAQAQVFGISSLAMSLRVLYEGIANDIATHIYVGSLPLDIRLPPRKAHVAEEWTRWGDAVSDDSDESDDDVESPLLSDEEDAGEMQDLQQRRTRLVLKPWKTLIVLPNTAGEPDPGTILVSRPSKPLGPFAMTAENTLAESVTVERDYRELTEPVQRLLLALNPMVSLVDLAKQLDLDLEDELYPLARYLINTGRAKLIDVIRLSLRNVFMPDTISNKSLPMIMRAWANEFPYLPTFDRFISRISASPQPYRKVLPEGFGDNDRDEYTRALYWLLANDLLIQAHEYVQVVARSEIKSQAKRQLVDEVKARRRKGGSEEGTTGLDPAQSPKQRSRNDIGSVDEASLIIPHPVGRERTSTSPDDGSSPDKDRLGFLSDPQSAIIDKPGRASPPESRCLRIIMESQDEEWQKRFAMCMRYFDGKHCLEEIQYQTDLSRKVVRQVLTLYHADLIIFQHP